MSSTTDQERIRYIIDRQGTINLREFFEAIERIFKNTNVEVSRMRYDDFINILLRKRQVQPEILVEEILSKKDFIKTDYIELLQELTVKTNGTMTEVELINAIKRRFPASVRNMVEQVYW